MEFAYRLVLAIIAGIAMLSLWWVAELEGKVSKLRKRIDDLESRLGKSN